MSSTELADNLRTTQAEKKLSREGIKGKDKANKAHRQVGTKACQSIKDLGGTMPEELLAPKTSTKPLKNSIKNRLVRGKMNRSILSQKYLGKLPEKWIDCQLGNICLKIVDGTHQTPRYTKEGIPFLRVIDIHNKNINLKNTKYISYDEFIEMTKKNKPEYGDVLLSKNGTIGITKVIDWYWDFAIFVSLALIKLPKEKSKITPEYLCLLLSSDILSRQIKNYSKTATVTNLHLEEIKKFWLLIPPTPVQKAIVSTLQKWDTAIEKTEALIDAKESQFRWLQNTLIRANSDKSPTKPLNSLSHIKKGKQLNRDTLDDSCGYPVWNGGVTPSGYTDKYNTVANTITISEGGNSCGFVNFCKEDFWLGGHCYAIEKLDASLYSDFLFFCLKANERRIMRLRLGSGLPNIQKKDIEKLQIQLPPLPEQQAIANKLNTARQEITLLKKLVDEYRTEKRGLMQKLLSGKCRIKTKENIQ